MDYREQYGELIGEAAGLVATARNHCDVLQRTADGAHRRSWLIYPTQ